jgi:aspartyl/asparaginyl beta-hydroxylase (cupin superfamily)
MNSGGSITVQDALRDAAAAMQAGNLDGALAHLGKAEQLAPRLADIQFNKAAVFKMRNDHGRALAAIDAALAIDPYHLPSLLSKGAFLEDAGRLMEAAEPYKAALTIAPTADRLSPMLAPAHARAQARVADEARRLKAYFSEVLASLRNSVDKSQRQRFDECVDIFAGVTRAYHSQPSLLHFPALPEVAYFDRAQMPWLEAVEAASEAIEAELREILVSSAIEGFVPYIAYPPGAPVNQWGALNHSRDWSTFFFWLNGEKQEEACRRAPRTAAVLEAAPMARIPGIGPTAMFSALAAKTPIPPHTGSTNVRAIVHLPLILPGPAWFRVGNHRREWRKGEAWAFDDTVEHEAMNEANETRVILIFDVWNPYLTEEERTLVSALLQAKHAYRRSHGARGPIFS